MLRLSLTILLAAALATLNSCVSGGGTNAPNHTIVTGYITSLDDEQIVVDDEHAFETANVTLWRVDGHQRTMAEFSVGMYVQVVASKLPPYETWVTTTPEPLD
jgi:hypothetical protein